VVDRHDRLDDEPSVGVMQRLRTNSRSAMGSRSNSSLTRMPQPCSHARLRDPVPRLSRLGKSHNGKRSFGFPVVKVRFAGAEGERVFGVLVGRSEKADDWVDAIRAAVS